MEPNYEEILKQIKEERGKLSALLESIKQFLTYDRFNQKILQYWRKGGKFVECPQCGGLCGEKTWDKIR